MVKFEQALQENAWPDWRCHYIDYKLLKRKIDGIIEAQEGKQEEILQARKHIFQGLLDEELTKALSFFKRTSAATRLETEASIAGIQGGEGQTREQRLGDVSNRIDELRALADDVTHLLEYVSLNMTAVRKILKKFKKHIEPLAPIPGFLTLEVEHPHDPGFHLSQGTFLPESMSADLAAMNRHSELRACSADIQRALTVLKKQRQEVAGRNSEDGSLPGSPSTSVSRGIAETLRALRTAQALSRRNARLVHSLHWSETQAGIFTKPPPEEKAVATTLGLFLVCAASALYMANYQLCLPTVTAFCRHLGVPASYAGYIVGSTDVAAIPITIVFSKWSNYSFKTPLVFAAFACILSNLLYCTSYDHGGLALLMLSRFMTGLGSSRSISRRYIADFTTKSKRTQASTAFVCSSAIGMAMGPLISFPLQQLPDTLFHGVRINPITAAGFIMAACWLLFALVAQLFFEEPLKASRPASGGLEDTAREPLLGAPSDDGVASMEEAASRQKSVKELQADAEAEEERREEWRAALYPTILSIGILWMLKMVQQGYMDGISLFTFTFFDWSSGDVGLWLTALGISALPVSAAVGVYLTRVPDSWIITSAIVVTTTGCLIISFLCSSLWFYIAGGCCLFLATLIMEAAATSALSKVMSVQLQQGILNAGLIATEAGTLGRLSGNVAIAVVGHITSTETPAQLASFATCLYCFFAVVLAAVQGGLLLLWTRFQV